MVLSFVVPTQQSAGDDDPEFQRLVTACSALCPPPPLRAPAASSGAAAAAEPSWQAALEEGMGWSCAEECAYISMHQHTEQRVADGKDVLQYFGKCVAAQRTPHDHCRILTIIHARRLFRRWPFYRLGGLQEPGAAIFSLLNLLAHYRGLLALRKIPETARSLAHGW